jgi:hypothetical protein
MRKHIRLLEEAELVTMENRFAQVVERTKGAR